MLTVKASAQPSKIHGIGLFADQKILKGTIMWKYNSRFDIAYDPEEVKNFPLIQQGQIDRYAYLSKVTGRYIYSMDDSRFTNHSSQNPNEGSEKFPDSEEPCGIAIRDIEIGEEILVNYKLFDKYDTQSGEAYLDS